MTALLGGGGSCLQDESRTAAKELGWHLNQSQEAASDKEMEELNVWEELFTEVLGAGRGPRSRLGPWLMQGKPRLAWTSPGGDSAPRGQCRMPVLDDCGMTHKGPGGRGCVWEVKAAAELVPRGLWEGVCPSAGGQHWARPRAHAGWARCRTGFRGARLWRPGAPFSVGWGARDHSKFMGAGPQRLDFSKEQVKPLRGSVERPQSPGALLARGSCGDQETWRGSVLPTAGQRSD